MISLLMAAAFFVGIHYFVSGTRLRTALVERTGEMAYLGLFSLLSLAGLVWLGRGYAQAESLQLWDPVDALRPLALLLTFFAVAFVTIGVTTPSPTMVGGGSALREGAAARGIQRITRHPFLWGVAMWAAAHLLVMGDLASLIFFGALLVLAVLGPPSIDAKRERAHGDDWRRFAASTSNVPFLAILQRRSTLELAELGWWRVGAALLLYALLLGTHGRLFGVSPFGP